MENEQSINYGLVEFKEALSSSFIEAVGPSDDRYSPRVVVNDADNATNVLSVLKHELVDCESFDFSIAFITSSGIQVLIESLKDLESRGVKGRILTSTYLFFNDPEALQKLLEFSNLEVKVFEGDLHAKGYFFNKQPISTFIIGSSNLTQKALTCNKEWNVLFRSYSSGSILTSAQREFQTLWEDPLSVPLTTEWIDGYTATKRGLAQQSSSPFVPRPDTQRADRESTAEITPNKMQRRALDALEILHARSERRALLISATGTGKTYLSALDVKEVSPKKILFIAHRKRILKASLESFQRVLGDRYTYGLFGEDSMATCQFAMVGTLKNNLSSIGTDEFDYVIIDEAHRVGAQSYREVVDYLRPAFLLGMTATPSRTDGFDVYELFNHVIAFRITLQDALDSEMLAPFHYFGIADLAIDEVSGQDFELFKQLTSAERVDRIVEKIELYSVEKETRRGLIFCSRNDEAAELSRLFNERGYKTVAISGNTSDADRDAAIDKLESGELEYIFSVDIMNEGVDIPSLNQIIMLRATESAIVFVQQLGRGLRTHKDKEFTLVLDFIGNYDKNFLIPIALSGDKTYSKDTLRKVVKNGTTAIPGCSTISFDAVAEARIFKALETTKFSQTKLLRQEYEELKFELGRMPTLNDFDANEAIDPMLYIKKFGSYQAFIQKYDSEVDFTFTPKELEVLKFISQKFAAGKSLSELELLDELLRAAPDLAKCEIEPSRSQAQYRIAALKSNATSTSLAGEYYRDSPSLVVSDEAGTRLSPYLLELLRGRAFNNAIRDILDFALARHKASYSNPYKETNFVLYQKYSRDEICRLLGWEKEPNHQNVGGYFYDRNTETFPVFIDYQKDPSISITTQYEDRFINENRLVAISKSNRTMQSPEIQMLNALSKGILAKPTCYLFMRKNNNDGDDGKEFYFLGEIFPSGEFEEIQMPGTTTSAVEICYNLDVPVRADLYSYLTSDIDVSAAS